MPSEPTYIMWVFKLCEQNDKTFDALLTQAAQIIALVLATAGMMFFTTPKRHTQCNVLEGGGKSIQRTVEARHNARQNQTCLPRKSLCASVNERNDRFQNQIPILYVVDLWICGFAICKEGERALSKLWKKIYISRFFFAQIHIFCGFVVCGYVNIWKKRILGVLQWHL